MIVANCASKVYPSSCKKIKPFLSTDFKSFELLLCAWKMTVWDWDFVKKNRQKFSYRSALMNVFPFLNHGSSSDNFVQIGINYHSDEVSVRALPHVIELLWNSNNVSFFEARMFLIYFTKIPMNWSFEMFPTLVNWLRISRNPAKYYEGMLEIHFIIRGKLFLATV